MVALDGTYGQANRQWKYLTHALDLLSTKSHAQCEELIGCLDDDKVSKSNANSKGDSKGDSLGVSGVTAEMTDKSKNHEIHIKDAKASKLMKSNNQTTSCNNSEFSSIIEFLPKEILSSSKSLEQKTQNTQKIEEIQKITTKEKLETCIKEEERREQVKSNRNSEFSSFFSHIDMTPKITKNIDISMPKITEMKELLSFSVSNIPNAIPMKLPVAKLDLEMGKCDSVVAGIMHQPGKDKICTYQASLTVTSIRSDSCVLVPASQFLFFIPVFQFLYLNSCVSVHVPIHVF